MPVGVSGRSHADSVVRRARALLGLRRGDDDRRRRIDRRRVRTVASGVESSEPNGRDHAAHCGSADRCYVSIDADWIGARDVVVTTSECLADTSRRRPSCTPTSGYAIVGADDAAFHAAGASVAAAASRCASKPIRCCRRSARNTACAPSDVHAAHRFVCAHLRRGRAHTAAWRNGGAPVDASGAAGSSGPTNAGLPPDRAGADSDSSQHGGPAPYTAVDAIVAGSRRSPAGAGSAAV